jgi:MFS family permease
MPPDRLADASISDMYRNTGFRAFLLARLAGMFATQIQAVVVAWQVYELTHDAMALAYVGLAQFLPMLFLLMPAGDLIDRRARKPILMLSWIVALLCSCALWQLSRHDGAGVIGIYITLAVFGCSRAFSGPALQSLLPQIVPREQLVSNCKIQRHYYNPCITCRWGLYGASSGVVVVYNRSDERA